MERVSRVMGEKRCLGSRWNGVKMMQKALDLLDKVDADVH